MKEKSARKRRLRLHVEPDLFGIRLVPSLRKKKPAGSSAIIPPQHAVIWLALNPILCPEPLIPGGEGYLCRAALVKNSLVYEPLGTKIRNTLGDAVDITRHGDPNDPDSGYYEIIWKEAALPKNE